MKPEDFKKIIRDSVNEELRSLLPEILKEFFENRTDSHVVKTPTVPKIRQTLPVQSPATKTSIQFTKNKALNDILNETVVRIPPEGTGMSIDGSAPSVTESPNLPGNLSEVFSRNYSSVLKKSAAINSNRS